MSKNWLVTGANGNLGRRLITDLLARGAAVHALVRSAAAQNIVQALAPGSGQLQVSVVDYEDAASLRAALDAADTLQGDTLAVVHLVGILKETPNASYVAAHENSSTALTTALGARPGQQVIYLSIVGSTPQAENACLASKGRAEQICLEHSTGACVLRVPMVLGEGDYASFALRKRASSRFAFNFRPASLEQPIYAGDVVQAIQAAAGGVQGAFDLGGPEVVTRRDLALRAAAILGTTHTTIGLPFALGALVARCLERLSANPPVTAAMLDVLDHDDNVDIQPALDALEMDGLTPLNDMLKAVLV
ncbi:MAG: NAD(P)H-binding protein [Pseudomonadota bacterium]